MTKISLLCLLLGYSQAFVVPGSFPRIFSLSSSYRTDIGVQETIEAGLVPPGVEVECSLDDVKIVRLSTEPIFIAEEPCKYGEANMEYWLRMTVPATKSQAVMSKLMAEAKKTANFPGFKKGQVPPWARPQMMIFCFEETVNAGMTDALEAAGLKALSTKNTQAEVLEDMKAMSKAFKPGTPLTFTAKLRAKQPFDEPAPSPPAAEPTSESAAVVDAEVVDAEVAVPEVV